MATSKARLFILDDVTPLGIRADRILDFFGRDPSVSVLRSDRLAAELIKKVPGEDTLVPIAYGGLIAFALLRREGLPGDFGGYLIAKRAYEWSENDRRQIPRVIECSAVDIAPFGSRVNILDDIVASGLTMNVCIQKFYGRVNGVSAFVVSSVVSRDDRYRTLEGSTIPEADNLYASMSVAGTNGRPAIYSLRYLLEKAKYVESDLTRFVQRYIIGDKEEFRKLMLETEEPGPLRLLRKSPAEFLERYSKKL